MAMHGIAYRRTQKIKVPVHLRFEFRREESGADDGIRASAWDEQAFVAAHGNFEANVGSGCL